MKADIPPAPLQVYQLKVVLRDCSPLIWRRLLVTSDTSVAQLHAILQITMGWEDLHLHRFRIHGKEYGLYREGGIWFADNPHQVMLADFKLRPGERFVYEYDMGLRHDVAPLSGLACLCQSNRPWSVSDDQFPALRASLVTVGCGARCKTPQGKAQHQGRARAPGKIERVNANEPLLTLRYV
jgi:hypothetical protein